MLKRLLLTGAFVLGSVAALDAQVYVRVGPPRPVVERRLVSPGPGYYWQNGYHRWDGGAYVWTPGRWVLPPRPRAVWVAPRWERRREGWYFREGRWR